MTTWNYIETIGQFFEARFKAQLQTELGLVVCMWGDLEQVFYPDANGDVLSASVPAIFIQPDVDETDNETLNSRRGRQMIDYRIIYVDRIAEGVTTESNRLRIGRVKDVILENPRLDNPAITGLTNAQIAWAKPVRTEFRPIEDAYVAQANAQLLAAALTVRVRVELLNVTT